MESEPIASSSPYSFNIVLMECFKSCPLGVLMEELGNFFLSKPLVHDGGYSSKLYSQVKYRLFQFLRKECKMVKGPSLSVKNREHHVGKSYYVLLRVRKTHTNTELQTEGQLSGSVI